MAPAELPFVAAGVWTYLPDAAHYFPLRDVDSLPAMLLRRIFIDTGDDTATATATTTELAISYLSAPCYFAVTMDAIALGRWFDAQEKGREGRKERNN